MSNTKKDRRVTINYNDGNRIDTFPNIKYSKLIIAYASVNGISKSEAGKNAIKHFIDTLPPDQRNRIQSTLQNTLQNKPQSKNNY